MNDNPAVSRWLYLILGVATLLRLSGLTAFSLSNDELSALARLQYGNISDVITYGVYPDFHPAGVQVFLYYWTGLFGFDDLIVRLPFALFGIGSVFLIFRSGKLLFGNNTGLFAAAALACLQFPLLYSQLARPYSVGLFFVLLAFSNWIRITGFQTRDTGSAKAGPRHYLLFVIGITGCLYSHYFAALQAGLICLAGIFFIRRINITGYVLSGIIILILYLPHADIFLNHVSKGGIGGSSGWLGPPENDFFITHLEYILNDSRGVFYMFFLLLAGYILINRGSFTLGPVHIILFIFILIPGITGYYYSLFVNPVLQHSVLLFSFPFFLLLIFSFSSVNAVNKVSAFPLLILIIGTLYSTVQQNAYYKTAHFSEFRSIGERVNLLANEYAPYQLNSIINIHNPYYIHHYMDTSGNGFVFDQYRIQGESEIDSFYQNVTGFEGAHLFYAFSNMYNDPLIEQVIRNYYPCLIDRSDFLRSGYRLFSREPGDNCLDILSFRILADSGFNSGPGADTVIFRSGTGSGQLDSENEFMNIAEFSSEGIFTRDTCSLEVHGWFHAHENNPGHKLVTAYQVGDSTKLWQSAELIDHYNGNTVWNLVRMNLQLNRSMHEGGIFKIYIWNEKSQTLNIDDFKVSCYCSIE